MSTRVLVYIILFLLYLPTFALVLWRLFPRLSPSGKLLAAVSLFTQTLILILAPEEARPFNARRVWSLDLEHTIPAAAASTQMALVGVAAFVTAWSLARRPLWRQLYLHFLVAVFLFIACDEYFGIHDRHPQWVTAFVTLDWEILYAMLGAVVVVATLLAAAHTPRRARVWHFCLLAGLALSATGALGVEQLRHFETCSALGFRHSGECLFFILEESLESLGIWLTLVAVLGMLSDAAPRRPLLVKWILYLAPFAWLSIIPAPTELRPLALPGTCLALIAALDILSDVAPRACRILRRLTILFLLFALLLRHLPAQFSFIEYRRLAVSATVTYEANSVLRVQRIDRSRSAITVRFFAEPAELRHYQGMGYSLHLVDQLDGVSYTSSDVSASWQSPLPYRTLTHGRHIFQQRMEVTIPPDAPRNRALWLVLTTWREEGDEFVRQTITASDFPLLDDTQVVLRELVLPAPASTTLGVYLADFENGLVLESVDMPATAQAGTELAIEIGWRSEQDTSEDYSQFLHFVNRENGEWWGFDQPPLGRRLATRLWYSGLADTETWQVPLPHDRVPGTYSVFTGLYGLDDFERLPATSPDGIAYTEARVPLGSLTIHEP